jgi:retron-type reverse transcriptase
MKIFLLPIISKIFERSVFNQLYEFLNANNLLSKYQFGFRPKYSTMAALIQMCDAWYENMDNVELNGVVFIDIRKAFDSINHNILLRKMKEEQFGISNIELKLFESYLSDREQVSFVNGVMSAPKKDCLWGPSRIYIWSLIVLIVY